MPAPLDIDREAVKAHAITYGVLEAARAFNINENTVKQWSARYGWLKPPEQVKHELPLSITCDTCRYWDHNRHCLNPKVGGMLEDDTDTIRTEQEDVPFITGPEFGCVHWEER